MKVATSASPANPQRALRHRRGWRGAGSASASLQSGRLASVLATACGQPGRTMPNAGCAAKPPSSSGATSPRPLGSTRTCTTGNMPENA